MRIGEAAARAGVSVKAVRYYEALGLVTPTRLSNGYRDYSDHDVRVLAEVRSLGQLGIPAERTRPFVECLTEGHERADDCPASLVAYRNAIAEITERIDALTGKRAALISQLRHAAYRGGDVAPVEEGATVVTDVNHLPPGLPEPGDDGSAHHLPGRPAPTLVLPATSGEEVALDRLGDGRTVIYVYPLTGRPDVDVPEGWDTIPGARGCTTEACDFRDHYRDLLAAGAAGVFGLSSQDSGYQREMVDRLGLPFAMLSDTDLALAETLGLPTFRAGGMTLFKRLTFVISGMRIEHAFYPVFPPNEHAQQVLAWLRAHPVDE
ncbi:MAG: MerR family transcriptional regulator [Acidimicrobiales bacterium]